jgi:hydrogenase nickel incorporation protein HypA/HybF
MHEFGLAEGVLDTVRQRAAGRKVTGIRVRFGVRHAVDEESLGQAFSMIAEGTEAAGAKVELVTVPASVTCRGCGFTGETTDLLPSCPRCGGDDVALTGGDEMTLESVTYAPAAAGTMLHRAGYNRPAATSCRLAQRGAAGVTTNWRR